MPAFIAPVACTPVPTSASTASTLIQRSIRAALAAGTRRVCVDVLIAAVDPRSRNFDDAAASTIFASLIQAVQPVLPEDDAAVRVVVSGSTAALRAKKWLDGTRFQNVSVGVLGVVNDGPHPRALVITDPPGTGDAISELRKALRDAHEANIPVVVHNHPREDALYKLLGYGGGIPYELSKYESVFLLAPFALRGQGEAPPPRFVLMRQYPGKWGLWRHQGDESQGLFGGEGSYIICEEYGERPTDNALMGAVSRSLNSS